MNSANESFDSSSTTSSEPGRTSIQAVPPPPESSDLQGLTPPGSPPAKSRRKRMTVESLTRMVARMDKGIVGVVMVLTFLLGSFAARNSDLWQHLATGRAIAEHGSVLRQDPFTFTAEGTWINSAWLSDLILYNAFRITAGGDLFNPDVSLAGPVLIAGKAILMVLLAWVMMRIRRPGQSLWAAAVCAAMAVVVLSRWAFLQPKVISFLFLGMTLYLLQRPEPGPEAKRFSLSRPIFAIPILFALWVNLDEWFILGPITVGLFLVGELIQQFLFPIRTGEDAPLPGRIGRRALLLVVGLAACLLNPYFHQAFSIPSDLWPKLTNSVLLSDDGLDRYFRQPFANDLLKTAFSPTNPSSADIAYYVLAAFGLISFVLNWADWRGWRTMVWLAFFTMSAYQARMIPFFAVVAGPITALNLQDFAARRYGLDFKMENPWKTISIVGRLATLTAGILLVVAAWPGMLHASPEDPGSTHHVAWQLEVDPSLRQAAGKVRELRLAGVMGDGNAFNFTPEIADYFAWFCPEEKCFFDRRYVLFSKVAESYVDVRSVLGPFKEKVQSQIDYFQKERDLQGRLIDNLSKHHINHLIISGPRFDSNVWPMDRLWADPSHWTVLYMDGRTSVFGWTPSRTPSAEKRFAAYALEPAPLAFGPDIPVSARAPLEAPREEESSTWRQFWRQIWTSPAPYSLNTDACPMWVAYSQSLRKRTDYYSMANQASWQILCLAGPVGAAGSGHYVPQAGLAMMLTGFQDNALRYDRRLGPPATALLAVRAGRRAVKENPQDYRAYLELAYAIQFLADVEEGSSGYLRQIRQIQQVAALRKALALNPDAIEVHGALSAAYLQMDLRPLRVPPPIDLAIDHMNKIVDIRLKEGRKGKQTEEEFQKEIEQRKLAVKTRREQVGLDRSQADYESEKRRQKSRFGQANEARNRGLYQEALNVLLDPDDLADRGPEGDRLALQLLILTGQLDQARANLTGPGDETLDSRDARITDPQIEFQIAAGLGDYARADEALSQLIQRIQEGGAKNLMMIVRDSTWARNFGPKGPLGMGSEMLGALMSSNAYLRDLADKWAMRGVLALEAGDPAKAQEYFDRGLQLVQSPVRETAFVGFYGLRTPLEAAAFIIARSSVPEPRASFAQQSVALRYRGLLQTAKEQAAKKTP